MIRFFKLTTLCLFGWTVFSAGTLTAESTGEFADGAIIDGSLVNSAVTATALPAPKLIAAPKVAAAVSALPVPHCEVPCGIYADQMRFEMMLEDTRTVAKAIASVQEITGKFAEQGPPDAKTMNQLTRWIANKESHATNTQQIVAQYFLTQRIKAENENYAKQLAAAHKVMVSAMKCKQDADPKTAEVLNAAILDLYRAYEGKEPKFHEEHDKK